MKHKHTFLSFFFAVALLPLAVRAQGQFSPAREIHPQRFSVGANFGLTLYSGDLDNPNVFPDTEHAWAVSGDVYLQMKLFTAGKILYGSVQTMLSYSPQKSTSAEYEFFTALISISGIMKFEFFNRSPLRPYLSGGIGVGFFDPKVKPYSPRAKEYHEQLRGTDNTTLVVPMTAGIVWTVTKELDILYQFTKTVCLTDNLDGWVSKDNDNFQNISLGLLYYF